MQAPASPGFEPVSSCATKTGRNFERRKLSRPAIHEVVKVLRAGGSYLEAREWWAWTALALVGLAGVLLTFYSFTAFTTQRTPWLVSSAAILAAAFVFAAAKQSLPRIARRLYAVRRGRLGERLVTQLTGRLSDDYYLINDIVLTHGNIDHVVVGPCGVLVLETKNVRGEIACDGDSWTVNGRRVASYSKQVKAGAMALRDLLANSRLRLQGEYVEAAVVLTDPLCHVTVSNARVGDVPVPVEFEN